MMAWLFSISGALVVSSVSLVSYGGLWLEKEKIEKVTSILVSLAVGVLLGDAFLHLIASALESGAMGESVMVMVLIGISLFGLLQKSLEIRSGKSDGKKIIPFAKVSLVTDGLHNFIDGVIIAISFLVSPAAGVATTAAILAHEIPQELADSGTLILGGYSIKEAARNNVLASLTIIPGVILALWVGPSIEAVMVYLLPLAAGGLLFIALVNLVPRLLKKSTPKHSFIQICSVGLGLGLMQLVKILE